jgi:TldD protein
MRSLRLAAIVFSFCVAPAVFAAAQVPADKDHTLQAMKDEMARAKSRLELAIPPSNQPVRPYYVEYRLLDMDIREVVGEFGALVTTGHNRTRLMNVGARVGDYKLDSSNFIGDENFRGFIGPSGSVGIDRDYDSLRQDLWIATDQAFKEAVETYSRKQAYLSSLARPSDINDFARIQVIQHVDPLPTSDWTNRNWEQEVRDTSAALRAFPQIYESRVTYCLVYLTEYLLTSEGTELRTNRSYAAIEAPMSTLAADGMALNHFYATYAPRPADLPSVDEVRKNLNVAGTELMAMRAAPPASDYTGPVLFESRAAAALIAQVLGPSLNGARPPVAFQPVVDQLMNSLGARSDWSGKMDVRVLPPTVTLVDDPSAKE